jgi:hypothetical protein
MAVILIFISFFHSFLYFIEIRHNYNNTQGFNKREAFIKSSLLTSFLSYLFCESYSISNQSIELKYKINLCLLFIIILVPLLLAVFIDLIIKILSLNIFKEFKICYKMDMYVFIQQMLLDKLQHLHYQNTLF